MTVKLNSQRFQWGENYAILHASARHIHASLTARGGRFAAGTGDWSHLRAIIIEMNRGRTMIADGLVLTNVGIAAQKVENDDLYDVAVEYGALDTAVAGLITAAADLYNSQPEMTFDNITGVHTIRLLTAGQNNQANIAVNTVLAEFTVG